MFYTAIAQFGFHVLLQSTLLTVAGFLAVRFFARHRPVVQSAILRATLIAVLVCPLASLTLNEIGVTDYAMFPAWESDSVTPSHDTTPIAMTDRTDLAEDKLTSTSSLESNKEQTAELLPYRETERLTSLAVGIPSPQTMLADPVNRLIAISPSPSSGSDIGSVIPKLGWILSLVWLTGTILFLTRLIVANISAARLRRSSRKADIAIQELCRQTSQTLGLPAPEIKTSPRIHSPCLIGIRNPAILLPAGETLSPSVLRDVFLHELAHLARRDCLFHLLARLATALLFFQPLIWVLARRLERIADDICDDYVVQYGQDRKGYAHTLVNFAEQLPVKWAGAEVGLGMVSPRSSLGRRVLRILDSTRSLSLRLKTGWVVTIGLLGISFTTCAALLINSPSVSVAEEQDQVQDQVQERGQESGDQVPSDENDKDVADDARVDPLVAPDQNVSRETPDVPNPDATEEPIFHFRGQVLSPDGDFVEGATINYAHWNGSDSPVLATVDGRGEFEFSISPSNPFYESLREDGGTFVAMADGYGPAVKSAHECETTGEMQRAFQQQYEASLAARSVTVHLLNKILSGTSTFRLVKDDVPLTGRVVDIDGQPVTAAILRVARIVDCGQDGLDVWEEEARQPGTDYYALKLHQGMSVGNERGGTTLNYIRSAKTDEHGRFTLRGIGRDRIVKLLISGPGIATSRVYARTRAGETIEVMEEARRGNSSTIVYHPATFTHVAGPSLPVEGIVRDSKTKQPIAGVTLQCYGLTGVFAGGWWEGMMHTVTDEQGRYRLEGLPIGKNQVLCLSPLDQPYIVSMFYAETNADEELLTKDFELTRGIWIEGRAHDLSTGEPIRSGRVDYFAFTTNPFAKAVKGFNGAHPRTRYQLNSDGTYRIPGLPGRGIVAIMADADHQKYQRGQGAEQIEGKAQGFDGYQTYPVILSSLNYHVLKEIHPTEDAESVQLDFEFDSGRSLEVRVVDRGGNPVLGGRYDGMMEAFNKWDPIPLDTLEVRGYQPEKPRRVQVFHKERKLVGHLVVEGQNPGDLTVTVEPWGEISGRLLDEAGVPKAGATIDNDFESVMNDSQTAMLPPNMDREIWRFDGFVTDADGRFTIAGLIPGKPLRLSVAETSRQNGFSYLIGEIHLDISLKPGEVRDLGDIQLQSERPE